MKQEKNLILIGLGPHARRIYYPLLEKYARQYDLRLRLVVDLQDQESRIRQYLAGRPLQPDRLFFADPCSRHGGSLEPAVRALLDQTAARTPIDGIIISTEPKAHKPYLLWAMEHAIDVLMDKPITAPIGLTTDPEAADAVLADYLEVETQRQRTQANLVVQCQRRNHAGYQFIKRYLTDFITQYQIPLSYIDIYHGDGMWCMPGELFERENHPYKYGYGKLMHSGYHFIDLFTWLAEVNSQLEHKRPDRAELFVKHFGPYDFLHQIDAADYRRLFGTDIFAPCFTPEKLQAARQFGEQDVFILCQLKRGDIVTTTATLNLQQNSFSRRAWTETPDDVYKGNGRVRHERVTLQVGTLLNIQVHSYQAYEVHKKDVETEGAGDEHHFDIYIFRNSDVVGGKPLEKFCFGEAESQQHRADTTYLGHNEQGREVNFANFLAGRVDGTGFASHRLTNTFLSKIYTCISKESHGEIPQTAFAL